MESKARDFFFDALVKSAELYEKTMDENTGRFLAPNGGWAVTHQDAMLAYAYLYITPGRENPYYQNPKALDTVLKAAQALRDWQYPDGQVEFIKVDGSKWGPIYMPWTFYHWLETYILLRDILPEETRKDWEIGLMPAMESYGKQDPEKIHNIPVWQAMCVHRAGKEFGREDWIQNADALIRNTCLAQDECGFWPEHKGPTTTYNFVYTHALGLYRLHGGSVDVLESLKRAIKFMQVYAYPNGALVETIDGRTKYSRLADGAKTGTRALPGCLSTRGGIRFIESQLNKYSHDHITLADTAVLLTKMDQMDDSLIDPDPGFEGFDLPDFTVQYGLGNIVRKGNREISLSAYTAPLTESRWGMDRQTFVSVWTPESDLVLGGGNSKNQPDHSTFVLKRKDGTLLSYIPTAGRIVSDGEISLDYGDAAVCSIRGEISDHGTITLTYSIDRKDPNLTWQVGLPLKPELDPEKSEIVSYRTGKQNVFEYNGAKVTFEGDCRVTLPSRTFNPYAEDGKPPLSECVMLVNIDPEGDTLTVTIEPAEAKTSAYPQNPISAR